MLRFNGKLPGARSRTLGTDLRTKRESVSISFNQYTLSSLVVHWTVPPYSVYFFFHCSLPRIPILPYISIVNLSPFLFFYKKYGRLLFLYCCGILQLSILSCFYGRFSCPSFLWLYCIPSVLFCQYIFSISFIFLNLLVTAQTERWTVTLLSLFTD